MIRIEQEIFADVSKLIREKYSKSFVTGEYVKSPPSFPCVSLVEADNSVLEITQDSDSNENHVSVLYELNVYSNKKTGKKSECLDIITIIDNYLIDKGFTRTMLNPIPNLEDATIYRMVARYVAVISKQKLIYRR